MVSFDAFRIRRFTAAMLLVLFLSTIFAQQISSADPADKETAKLVAKMIPQFHLNRQEVNDKVSGMLFDQFLKALDPQKLYFLESDIKSLEAYRTQLDDQLKEGNVDFAYVTFEKYKQRLAAQVQVAHHWINQDHDFTLDEEIETDGKKLAWAKTQEELNDRWRKRIKYDLLLFKLDGSFGDNAAAATPDPRKGTLDAQDKPKSLEEVRERLHKRYRNAQLAVEQYSTIEQLEIYLTAFTQCFDPHSTYMSPNSWEDFEIQMKLSLEGIGAALRSDDGYTIVAQIVPGGAAAEDGQLKVKDKIIGVGQEQGEIVDIFEMKLSEVVRMIRGPAGTVVRLQVKPDDGGELKTIALKRKKIELKESEVKGEIIDTQDRLGRPGRIGVISLPSFYRDFAGAQGGGEFKSAAVDMAKVLGDFAKQNVDAVIVDLRNNGGGALTEAIEVSGHFIDKGPVVQVREPSGYVRSLDDENSGVLYSGPLVVMCNRLSASASEIFAGVIKDYKRGLIIGDTTTHGKGTVQNLMDVSPRQPFRLVKGGDRGKLKLTIQQFYRVNGDSTQNRGVRSDIVLPSLIDHWDLGESFLDNALPFDQIRAARYSEGRMANPEMISALQKESEARVVRSDDFKKLNLAVQRYLERKNRTQLSLNEAKVLAERKQNEEAEKETEAVQEALEEQASGTEGPVFPKSAYNDEALNIALDYVAALRGQQTVKN